MLSGIVRFEAWPYRAVDKIKHDEDRDDGAEWGEERRTPR